MSDDVTNELFLDCSTGVSGDMLLASMSHALEEWLGEGRGFDYLSNELNTLGIDGFELKWSKKMISGISTYHVDVVQTKDQPLRHYTDLIKIVDESLISGRAKERSKTALKLLGEAEGKIHGVGLEGVHFHEIGAVDTIVDICGSMVLLDALQVEKVTCTPVDLGSGFVDCAHGRLPVPAPACAELARGLVTFGSDCSMERSTPTGLTILKTVVDEFGSLPLGSILSVGYGSGGRSCDEQPTYVRAFALKTSAVTLPDRG